LGAAREKFPYAVRVNENDDCLTGTHTDLAIADTLPISVTRSYQQSETAERTFGVGSNFDYNMYLYAQSSGSTDS
jgi:hypothetical protein